MKLGYQHVGTAVVLVALFVSVQSMGSGKISKIRASASGVELTVDTVPGLSYQLQCREHLLEGDWADEGAAFAAIVPQTVYAVETAADQCNFRVVKVEVPASSGPTEPGAPPVVPAGPPTFPAGL
ncbi:hypothetical protein [Pontiella sp.]|uniref:hypothetical protein n=1 Tax=Pontiella sp. TaxID=2837462 RepID=UPI00356755C4